MCQKKIQKICRNEKKRHFVDDLQPLVYQCIDSIRVAQPIRLPHLH